MTTKRHRFSPPATQASTWPAAWSRRNGSIVTPKSSMRVHMLPALGVVDAGLRFRSFPASHPTLSYGGVGRRKSEGRKLPAAAASISAAAERAQAALLELRAKIGLLTLKLDGGEAATVKLGGRSRVVERDRFADRGDARNADGRG
ncbi:MAG: hypothetical protein HC861_07105, partial [Rhodospirillaceae bacterium]|nr:hypothetical protein [Rhodospirillaceae bacterium]